MSFHGLPSRHTELQIRRSSRLAELELLQARIHACGDCHSIPEGHVRPDLLRAVRQAFPSHLDSELVLIGQAPAANQVRLTGIPFFGIGGSLSKGGRFLERHLNRIGYTLDPSDGAKRLVYSTDLIKCFPGRRPSGSGDYPPHPREISFCRRWLVEELAIIQARVLLLMGGPTIRSFFREYLGVSVSRISPTLGTRHQIELAGRSAVAFTLPHSSSMVPHKGRIFEETFTAVGAILDSANTSE
jgi:uracil-DNA glycosylase family 4